MKIFDSVFDSQRVFRCLLQAAASPGRLFALPPAGVEALESLALTLLDHEVTFRMAGEGMDGAEERLSRMTGARTVTVSEADFVLISGGDSDGVISRLKRGTLERPEIGATAIYVVKELSNRGPLTLRLEGPGISGERALGVEGLPAAEITAIQESRSDYPLGVDVYLVDAAERLAALPRSARMELIG